MYSFPLEMRTNLVGKKLAWFVDQKAAALAWFEKDK
jgi:hypothetical protein